MNYLVGASGCLRKGIYELLELEKVPEIMRKVVPSRITGNRVKTLKAKYPTVPPDYFDALANIQGMTSEQLHEGDWKPWTQDEFKFLVGNRQRSTHGNLCPSPRKKHRCCKKFSC